MVGSGHKIRVEVDASLAARMSISAEVVNYVAQCIDIIKVYKRNLAGACVILSTFIILMNLP